MATAQTRRWDPTTAFLDAAPRPYWTDRADAPAACAPLVGEVSADLAIVGGGFTGLWAAVEAKERDPDREVVLIESETIAFGASGRNGGFIEPSLTHGLENGTSRFSDSELSELERIGNDNMRGIEAALSRYDIDCDLHRDGVIWCANQPHQLDWFDEMIEKGLRYGHDVVALDEHELRREVNSPMYLGGVWDRGEGGLIDPAQLAWGLRRAALSLGVKIFEGTRVERLVDEGNVRLYCPRGTVSARRVVIGTSAYKPLIKSVKHFIAPVYDYVLMTEPLSESQRDAIGWRGGQGLSDGGNQFHYHRVTASGCILYGGYDAIHYYGSDVSPHRDQRHETFALLSKQFFATFPQLEGLIFSHRCGGPIDTCTRFFAFFGTACNGKVAYVAGYTGLGVGATRFGARTTLDLVDGVDSELTRLPMVKSKPFPFPPEPLRSAAIQLTRREIARADRNRGDRGLWLKTLDKLGLGFDS